jgi:glycosyltransferase involved in cell wall biosynthesis
VPCIVHTPHGHIFYGYFSPPVTRFFMILERVLMRCTDRQITLTEGEKRDYCAFHIGTASQMDVIYSGVALQPFLDCSSHRQATRQQLGLTETDFVAGTVARLVPVKNHMLIIDAVGKIHEQIPALRCLFVGDGDMQEILANRITQLGLSTHFILAGWRDDIPQVLSACDIFIMVSINEGMGRAFVEAQAAGLPVIGTRAGGVPEVVDEGKTGLLVDPDDSEGLADAIVTLYNKRERLEEMAVRCRHWVDPRFNDETMVKKIEAVYQSVYEGKTCA